MVTIKNTMILMRLPVRDNEMVMMIKFMMMMMRIMRMSMMRMRMLIPTIKEEGRGHLLEARNLNKCYKGTREAVKER